MANREMKFVWASRLSAELRPAKKAGKMPALRSPAPDQAAVMRIRASRRARGFGTDGGFEVAVEGREEV